MGTLTNEATDHALERSMRHLHHHALSNHRARVVGQVALNELSDAVDLLFGNRRGLAFERDNVHDTGTFQDGQPIAWVEAGEAVSGKERPVDPLLPILPAAPSRDSRQKGRDPSLFELF